jgi:hypothetical protein
MMNVWPIMVSLTQIDKCVLAFRMVHVIVVQVTREGRCYWQIILMMSKLVSYHLVTDVENQMSQQSIHGLVDMKIGYGLVFVL